MKSVVKILGMFAILASMPSYADVPSKTGSTSASKSTAKDQFRFGFNDRTVGQTAVHEVTGAVGAGVGGLLLHSGIQSVDFDGLKGKAISKYRDMVQTANPPTDAALLSSYDDALTKLSTLEENSAAKAATRAEITVLENKIFTQTLFQNAIDANHKISGSLTLGNLNVLESERDRAARELESLDGKIRNGSGHLARLRQDSDAVVASELKEWQTKLGTKIREAYTGWEDDLSFLKDTGTFETFEAQAETIATRLAGTPETTAAAGEIKSFLREFRTVNQKELAHTRDVIAHALEGSPTYEGILERISKARTFTELHDILDEAALTTYNGPRVRLVTALDSASLALAEEEARLALAHQEQIMKAFVRRKALVNEVLYGEFVTRPGSWSKKIAGAGLMLVGFGDMVYGLIPANKIEALLPWSADSMKALHENTATADSSAWKPRSPADAKIPQEQKPTATQTHAHDSTATVTHSKSLKK